MGGGGGCFFFFQAEDGIRDLVRSRGLGDVYKRQAVYDMLCRADSVGVFQVESRAQMTMLPRLRPRCFYDLVLSLIHI